MRVPWPDNVWFKLILLFIAALVAALAVRGAVIAARSPKSGEDMIAVYDRSNGRLMNMPLEEYVLLCTAAEMPASFGGEALAAQAVAARTFAARRYLNYSAHCSAGAVCTDSTCCQAYTTYAELKALWGKEYNANLKKLRTAVSQTSGIVAMYGGEPIEALYHSCSGGRTEDAANVFAGGAPYLLGVSSPGEEDARHYRDKVTFTNREFTKKVNSGCGAKLDRKKLGEQVEILSRFESGRVKEIRLGDATLTGRELRKLLGLYSANFDIEFKDGEVEISTLGYGHGAGMSQYGANAMAKAGASFDEILKHYYTGVELMPLP